MQRALEFIRNNRVPVALGVGLLLIGLVAVPYVLGLSGAVGAVLALFAIAAAVAIFRIVDGSPISLDESLPPAKFTASLVAGIVVIGLVIQAVPFGWDRSNPPVTGEPAWDSPRARELVVRACFDCHSNEVAYPWYSKIAPASWAVQLHVQQGRDEVNYSEWDRPQKEADESAETVIEGEMPPGYYTLFGHPEARLTDAELRDLIAGLEATFGSDDHD